ncbi:SRPBCC family protein [Lichenihabitans sp. PAMC28606]|uniref:SRPBCC family protein n=1 Tax=Lichenihabitans sp. PAMC28606 TaxID=2880932 RepID=UPI001D0A6616|nr:SRPBCC family protein [Lichenihabitans sp. PAMC28606]UDL96251.1 SRPBCC family protein [Lichenihabitans sp. PAMC28606]
MNVALRRQAEAERMIPDAPVQASRSIIIGTSADAVWRLLTDVADWPRWYGYLKNAQLAGAFASGTALTYGDIFKHRLRIANVKQGELAMLYGTMAGYTGITRWDVKTVAGGGTKVIFTESSSGPLIKLLYGNASLGKHLERWLIALKVEAEKPSR